MRHAKNQRHRPPIQIRSPPKVEIRAGVAWILRAQPGLLHRLPVAGPLRAEGCSPAGIRKRRAAILVPALGMEQLPALRAGGGLIRHPNAGLADAADLAFGWLVRRACGGFRPSPAATTCATLPAMTGMTMVCPQCRHWPSLPASGAETHSARCRRSRTGFRRPCRPPARGFPARSMRTTSRGNVARAIVIFAGPMSITSPSLRILRPSMGSPWRHCRSDLDHAPSECHAGQATLADGDACGAEVKSCSCHRALQNAIITAPDQMPASLRRKLALLMDRVVPARKGIR